MHSSGRRAVPLLVLCIAACAHAPEYRPSQGYSPRRWMALECDQVVQKLGRILDAKQIKHEDGWSDDAVPVHLVRAGPVELKELVATGPRSEGPHHLVIPVSVDGQFDYEFQGAPSDGGCSIFVKTTLRSGRTIVNAYNPRRVAELTHWLYEQIER